MQNIMSIKKKNLPTFQAVIKKIQYFMERWDLPQREKQILARLSFLKKANNRIHQFYITQSNNKEFIKI